jgi:ribose transport system substrate-binding protein
MPRVSLLTQATRNAAPRPKPALATFGLALVMTLGACEGRSADKTAAPPATQPTAETEAGKTITSESPAASAAGECQRKPVANPAPLRIAVVPMGATHEFWKSIHAGAAKAELELPGVQVIWKAPLKEGDREAQINIVENFINAGVSGIVLAPTDNVALLKPVRTASQAGIGVVIADGDLNGEVCQDYASVVATDSYVGGQKGARRLGRILDGKGNVLLLRCQVGFLSTMRREQGFLDVMAKEFPGIRIVSSDQYGGATAESAQNKAEGLLGRFSDLDGIFCPNESTTFGMLRALQASGRAGAVKFVGFDSSEKLIQALANRELNGLVLQDPLNMGYTAVKTLVAYLRGEKVRTRIDTGSEVATPENMNEPRIKELLSPPIGKYLP